MRATPDGAVVRIHAVPGARRSGLAGFHGDAVRVRLAARPVEGAANQELVALLAAVLGVRRAAVALEAGTAAREKRVRVTGLSPEAVRERVRAALCVDTGGRRI